MKKIIVVLLIVLSSCGPSKTQLEQDNEYASKYSCSINFRVVKIDSCEYIYKSQQNVGTCIIHKANCNNPIHKTK